MDAIEKMINSLPICEKGYQINLEKIEEGYLFSGYFCSASNLNQAKQKLLKGLQFIELKRKYTDEPITYMNIPVIRCKDADMVVFEGDTVKRHKIRDILHKRKRDAELDAILNDEKVRYCYIYKNGYYMPGYCGYTGSIIYAGVYEKKDAIEHARGVNEIRILPINEIEHNKAINDFIEELKTRLISIK